MKLNVVKIKKELERLGLTQTWLGLNLGVSRQRICQILKAASLKNAERIGKALGINPRDLIL